MKRASGRNRTHDLMFTKQLLYQLSYRGTTCYLLQGQFGQPQLQPGACVQAEQPHEQLVADESLP